MELPGRLGATTLGDLLGRLHREQTSGMLELVEESAPVAGRSHRIQLGQGLVEAVTTPLDPLRLGELLAAEGLVTRDVVWRLPSWSMSAPEATAGELLLRHAALSSDTLRAALRHQLRRRLDAVFQLRDAWLRFHVPRPRRPLPFAPLPLAPSEFLYGRPRARDRRPRRVENATSWRRSTLDPRRARALAALGLDEGADAAAIREAFRRLARERHPDRFPQANAAEKAEHVRDFSALTAAYHVLLG